MIPVATLFFSVLLSKINEQYQKKILDFYNAKQLIVPTLFTHHIIPYRLMTLSNRHWKLFPKVS